MKTLHDLENDYNHARSELYRARGAVEIAKGNLEDANRQYAYAKERLEKRVGELIALTAEKVGV